jgi:NADH dehydrogenase (ubiquinone) Fe-S protein 4
MGWTSTADPLENVGRAALAFDTEASARAFCERHGWRYSVKQPALSLKARPKHRLQYGDNFSVKRKGIPEGGLVSETMGGGGGGGAKGKGKKK